MSEKREEFLRGLRPADGNKVFAAMNTSGRTREAYGKAEIENKKAIERSLEFKKAVKNWNLAPDAALIESGEIRYHMDIAEKNLNQAKKDIEDSKQSIR